MDIKEHDVIQYENWGALYEAIVISVNGEALNVSVRSGPMTGEDKHSYEECCLFYQR